jgi:hypothetical protein
MQNWYLSDVARSSDGYSKHLVRRSDTPQRARQRWSTFAWARWSLQRDSQATTAPLSTWSVLSLAPAKAGRARLTDLAFSRARSGSCQKSAPSEHRPIQIFKNKARAQTEPTTEDSTSLRIIEGFWFCRSSATYWRSTQFLRTRRPRPAHQDRPFALSLCFLERAAKGSCSSHSPTAPSTSKPSDFARLPTISLLRCGDRPYLPYLPEAAGRT